MTYEYQSAEYDAFGWPACRLADPGAAYGLDYESARDATPRWFAVSSGNGNNGVSHTFPDYYVRCSPDTAWGLARAAMLSEFKPGDGIAFAIDNMTVNGEADYTITAMILDPPGDETESESPDYQEIAESNGFILAPYPEGFAWCKDGICDIATYHETELEAWQDCCEENDLIADESDDGSWSDANGAWLIVEVFAADDDFDPDDCCAPAYESLAVCFSDDLLKLAAE